MKKFFLLMLIFVASGLHAQYPAIETAGRNYPLGDFCIIIPKEPTAIELQSAGELQKYLGRITGVNIAISDDQGKPHEEELIVGKTLRNRNDPEPGIMNPDEFSYKVTGPSVIFSGGSHKGLLYGVYDFLEKYLDCRFWAPGEETVPQSNLLRIPQVQVTEKPAFDSREVYYAGMDEQDFTDKMRGDRHAWKGGEDWGLWVHTMFTLVPPEIWFETHPEYYALMGGKRTQTQLCLSNPDVLQITIGELGKRMKEQPGKRYWSVSQMDTYGYCECASCNGPGCTPSGSMLNFVNEVAAAFPDKVISTLAYQYTRSAPSHIKPSSNVNIMLCTIECDRSRPLESDTSDNAFLKDLQNWAAISDDILVWDYVIQFTNMIAPFPNLPVLQPNIQLFRKYGVTAVFEQGCHGTYSELQELRQYLLSKLLWNPDVNLDSLQNQFLDGYYGAAGPFIAKYLHHMEGALKRSGETLWIYSSPMQETGSFLSPADIRRYNELFDQAEAAVTRDSVLMNRVIKARLPLRYAILEIAKKNITGPDGFLEPQGDSMVVKPEVMNQLQLFTDQANLYGVKTIHERNLAPDAYYENTMKYFRNAFSDHLAKGKPCFPENKPSPKYSAEGAGSLTDGKRGSPNYYVLWQGFEGEDFLAVIDLGEVKQINYLGAEFLQDLASWIFYPADLKVSVSVDSLSFREAAVFESLSCTDPLLIRETGMKIPETSARYVHFAATGQKTCPGWHIGHGGKAWLFTDELIVDFRK